MCWSFISRKVIHCSVTVFSRTYSLPSAGCLLCDFSRAAAKPSPRPSFSGRAHTSNLDVHGSSSALRSCTPTANLGGELVSMFAESGAGAAGCWSPGDGDTRCSFRGRTRGTNVCFVPLCWNQEPEWLCPNLICLNLVYRALLQKTLSCLTLCWEYAGWFAVRSKSG